jgi:electron transfer flavoprotein beta subunit
MKIVVLIKSVPDSASLLQIAADNKSIFSNELQFIMNPYDEFALEEAVRLKETRGGEVVVVSMGNDQAVKCIRQALAVGADSAIWIRSEKLCQLTPRSVAMIIASVIRELDPDVIFAGKQAIDDDASQVPERVAELLNLPHVSALTKFSFEGEKVTVDRQVEGGHYTIETTLPALFTTDKGLNVPRYPKLTDILSAKRKGVLEIEPSEIPFLQGELEPGLEVVSMRLQKQKRTAKIMQGGPSEQVDQLIPLLRTEGFI